MKNKYLIWGLVVGGAYALVNKYKTFWNKLTFSLGKAKVKLPYPYNNLNLNLQLVINNPTKTSIELRGVYGNLYYQGKHLTTITGVNKMIGEGITYYDVNASFTIQNLINISGFQFDTSSYTALYRQLIRTPFVSDITIVTNLGKFDSKETWVLQDLIQ